MRAEDYELVRRILEEKGIDKQRAKAADLFENHLAYVSEQVPLGGWDAGSFLWPDAQKVGEELQEQECFFDFFAELFGSMPAFLSDYYERFKRNGEQMKRLAGLDRKGRMNTPTSEFFPYFNDFDSAVRSHFHAAWLNGIDLANLVFVPEFVARGGFADIYKIHDKAGNFYALKLFHPVQRVGWQEGRWTLNQAINRNLFKNKDLFLQKPFAVLRAMAGGGCYIMDFANGENVENILGERDIGQQSKGVVLLAYAEMLRGLHTKGYVFVDNNWGAVVLGDDNVSIVDYDLATLQEDSLGDNHFSRKICNFRYASLEQVLNQSIIPISDLEGFARMAVYLVTRDRLFAEGPDTGFVNSRKRECTSNSPVFVYSEILDRLPKQLRKVVGSLLIYPRDPSIIADDFICAVKQDYRL